MAKMKDTLREKAQEKVEAKHAFYIISAVFASASTILYVVSLNVGGSAAFWIQFPIMILGLVLGIIYVSMFGISLNKPFDTDWKEEEIEREMARLSLQQKAERESSDWETSESVHYQEWVS